MDYKRKLASIEACRKTIDAAHDALGYYGQHRRNFIQNAHRYRWGHHEQELQKGDQYAPDLKTLSMHAETVYKMQTYIQDVREEMRKTDATQSSIEKAAEATRIYGQSSIGTTFKSASFEVRSDIHTPPSYEKKIRWSESDKVYLPVTWTRKVYENDIGQVKAGDGWRFVMDCKERKLDRLNDEDIRAFSCLAMKRKNDVVELESAWVFKYHTDGGKAVTSYHKDFARAESLLRRRIKDEAANILLNF